MRYVKRSLTLPKPLNAYMNRKAREAAKARGERPNFSAAIADLIVADRNAELSAAKVHEQKEAA